jgi:hypothetical protein
MTDEVYPILRSDQIILQIVSSRVLVDLVDLRDDVKTAVSDASHLDSTWPFKHD